MLNKLYSFIFLSLFFCVAHANIPEHVNTLIFEQSGFNKNLVFKIPQEDSREKLEKVRTTDYGVLTIQPILSSSNINPVFLQYLVKHEYAEIIHEDWKSRGSRNPMYFLFYKDELFNELPDVRQCNNKWCIHVGNRELVSIEYTNSYKGSVFGYETDIYSVVFKYKLTSQLPHLTPSAILYTGKAKAYLDLDDGTWKLINFELEDKNEMTILDQISDDYPEFEFSVHNTLVATSIKHQTQEKKPNEISSAVKLQNPVGTFNNAMIEFQNENFGEAILLFTKVIDSQKLTGVDELIAFLKRGEAYETTEQAKKAINDYSVALEKLEKIEGLKDYKAEFYYRRGYLNEQVDQKQQALRDYTNTIEIDSSYLRAYNNRGNLYFEFEDYEKAIQDLDQYIQNDDQGWPQAYYVRGMAKLILEQHDESVKDLRIAASLGYKDAQTALDQQGIQWQGAYAIYSIHNLLDQCENLSEGSSRLVIILANKTESMKSLKALGIFAEKFMLVSNDSLLEGLSNGGLVLDERQFKLAISDPKSQNTIKTISGAGFAYADIETKLGEIIINLEFEEQTDKLINHSGSVSVLAGQCMILNIVDLKLTSQLPESKHKSNAAQTAIFNTENVPKIHNQPLHFDDPNLAFESIFEQGLIDVITQATQSQTRSCKAEIANLLWSLDKFELSEQEAPFFPQQLNISSLDDVMTDKLETALLYELSRIILKQPQRAQLTEDFMRSIMAYLMGKLITSSYLEGKSLNEYIDLEATVDLDKIFEKILTTEQLQYFVLSDIDNFGSTGNTVDNSSLNNQVKINSIVYFYNPYTRYFIVVVQARCDDALNNITVFMTEVEKLRSKSISVENTFKDYSFEF